jgi:hypothetical protein
MKKGRDEGRKECRLKEGKKEERKEEGRKPKEIRVNH